MSDAKLLYFGRSGGSKREFAFRLMLTTFARRVHLSWESVSDRILATRFRFTMRKKSQPCDFTHQWRLAQCRRDRVRGDIAVMRV